jgi:opacity protein-like surface antigen
MKKMLFAIISLVMLFSTSAFAALHLGLDAGYSYVSMNDLRNGLTSMKDSAISEGKNATLQKFGDSIYTNLDMDLGLSDIVTFGPRVGAQFVLPADIKVTDSVVTTKNTYSAVLVPLELGGDVNIRIPLTSFLIKAGAYAGYGLAFTTQNVKLSGSSALPGFENASYDNFYQGGGLMADLTAAFEIFFANFFTVDVNIGYRYARFNNLKAVDETKIGGNVITSAGSMLADPSGQGRTVDFSGLNAGIGLNFRF